MNRPALSLQGRALQLLSRREHAVHELKRKLAPHAASEEELDALLDRLQRQGWLSDARAAESTAHRLAKRHGARRIQHQLAQMGVPTDQAEHALLTLRESEPERAAEVWRAKFGVPATTVKERARHIRFLLARGFAPETVYRLVPPAQANPGDDAHSLTDPA